MPSQSISPGCSRRYARIPVYHRTTAGACRRNIPIPSVPGSGADANPPGAATVRKDGRTPRVSINSGDEFEAGFCAPDRHKKGARCQLSIEGLGETIARKLSCALVVLLAKSKQDITRTDNHYTALNIFRRSLQVFDGIKGCLPFIVMSVGYAEL